MGHLFVMFGLLLASTDAVDNAEKIGPGSVFTDCENCPEMVVVPPGEFMMGSHINLPNRVTEIPLHKVTISKAFAIGKYEVTFAEWDLCVAEGGCAYSPDELFKESSDRANWPRGDRPVWRVSWHNAQTYIKWLNSKTGQTYRLPTEAEWEYMARAGTTTPYTTGATITQEQGNFTGRKASRSRTQNLIIKPVAVDSYPPNAFGVYNIHGGESELTQDCWHENFVGAPTDGSAWGQGTDCEMRTIRGGAWSNRYRNVRTTTRMGRHITRRSNSWGFRLARDLKS